MVAIARLLLISILVSKIQGGCHGFSSKRQHRLPLFSTKSTFFYATPNDHVETSGDHPSDPSHETTPLTLYLADKTDNSSVLGADLDHIENDVDDLKPLILANALQKLNISHALSFHSRSSRAQIFVEKVGPFLGEDTLTVSVNGSMAASKRDKLIFQALESPKSVVANSQALLSRDSVYNASWGLVYLADPVEDLNVVCQMLSQVGCAAPSTTRGYLLFPLVDKDLNNEMDRVYWLIWTIFKAMIVNDPALRRDVYFLADEAKRLGRELTPEEFPETVHQAFLFPSSASLEMRNKMLGRLLAHAGKANAWDRMFDLLLRYNVRHSHCHVPYSHVESDAKLGTWLRTQRQQMKKGTLPPYKQRRLEAIGVIWDVREAEWERLYALLECYRRQEWHCDVPQPHTGKGANLEAWVERQRRKKEKGTLDPEKERRLDEIGVVWKVYRTQTQKSQPKWEAKFFMLQQYADREGHCSVPVRYEEDGARLGFWLQTQRHHMKQDTLTFERQCRLQDIGVLWDASEARWVQLYILLERFGRREGHCNVQQLHTENGASLGTWLTRQRQQNKKGVLLLDRQRRLDELGIDWEVRGDESKWEASFLLLQRYKDREGRCSVPQSHMEDEAELGEWLQTQRRHMKTGTLDIDRRHRLGSMGVDWELFDARWERNYSLLERFKIREGHCNPPQSHIEDGVNLGNWLARQGRKKREGSLSLQKLRRLEEMGVTWGMLVKWEAKLLLLQEYADREGHCNVPKLHVENGTNIGTWLQARRQQKKKGELNLGRQRRFEEIGVLWDASEARWEQFYALLKCFKSREGHCNVPWEHTEEGGKLGAWLARQRQEKKKGTLHFEKQLRLDEVGVTWEGPRASVERRWEAMFFLLQQYADREEHCSIPVRYEEDGARLGKWLSAQRRQMNRDGLDIGRQCRLEDIGVFWDASEAKWERNYALLKRYKSREGHSNLQQFHIENGVNLGSWLTVQRRLKKKGALLLHRQRRLEEMGIDWNVSGDETKWQATFPLLQRYKGREGHCNVLESHEEDGVKLGKWLQTQCRQMRTGVLDLDRQRQLEDIGVDWELSDAQWEPKYALLERFKAREGNCNVPQAHIEDGVKLGCWLTRQRHKKRKGALSLEKQRRLEGTGVAWKLLVRGEAKVSLLERFKGREGHCNVPQSHAEDGVNLGTWLQSRRQQQKKGELDPEMQRRLEDIGVLWDPWEAKWECNAARLARFKSREGHCNVPRAHTEEGVKLGTWLNRQRHHKKKGSLQLDRQRRLGEICIVWETFEAETGSTWNEKLSLLQQYRDREGHCHVPTSYEEDGAKLGKWMSAQRRQREEGALNIDKLHRLESIGVIWDSSEARWEPHHYLQKRYKSPEGHCDIPQLHTEDGDHLGKRLTSDQRRQKKKGTLHPEKERRIDALGVSSQARWKSASKWEANVSLLERYAVREGHCHVPPFHSEDGFKLGRWLQIQRSQKEEGKLDPDKHLRLENMLGVFWDPEEAKWERHYVLLKRYGKQQRHCIVDHHHIENGDKLGTWLKTQRRHKQKGGLAPEKQRRLEEIGVIWEVGPAVIESKWEAKVSLLKRFKGRQGHCKVTRDHKEEGVQLGVWLDKQRQRVRSGTMGPHRQRSLENIGVFWEEQTATWEKNFSLLVKFKAREGHCNVPLSHVEVGLNLRTWLDKERKAKREGTLDDEKQWRLEELGVSWDMFEVQWEESFSRFVKFTKRENRVSVPKDHVEDGIRLSIWIQSQRRAKKNGKMHPDRQQRLEELGAVL